MTTPASPPPEILEQFGIAANTELRAAGIGNINTTWLAGAGPNMVLQNINTDVFGDPVGLMANAVRVASALEAAGHQGLRYALAGDTEQPLAFDGSQRPWRAYQYVPGTVAVIPETINDVRWVAEQFGAFDAALNGGDGTINWHVSLPDFHNQAAREAQLAQAISADAAERANGVAAEIDRLHTLLDRLHDLEAYRALQQAPDRIAHHDAKAANVVRHDDDSGSSIIDLDTVMPGTILSDVGELVRSCSRTATEDHPDAVFDPERAIAAIQGFVAGWAGALDPAEMSALPVAGAVLTLQNATRFLTDYLNGDVYFNVTDPEHNLRRFRAMATHGQSQLNAVREIATNI